MKGFQYQLKNIGRDKMCILTFLLPVIVALAVSMMSGNSFKDINENSFGIIAGEMPDSTAKWLGQYGSVKEFGGMEELKAGIIEPSTQMIGVVQEGDGIRTLVAGDEFQIYRKTAYMLPGLFEGRRQDSSYSLDLVKNDDNNDGLKSLLVVITMVTAMFMGCTFNAMSMISEKEEGIEEVNEILPMTRREYILQKIMLGFAGGLASTILTGCVCMQIGGRWLVPLLFLMILSAYIAALAGVFIGRFSQGLMAGIVCIKMSMILFLAPPILCYLIVPRESIAYAVSYVLPSAAAFYGLMDLLNGQEQMVWRDAAVLAVHGLVWSLVFVWVSGKRMKKRNLLINE